MSLIERAARHLVELNQHGPDNDDDHDDVIPLIPPTSTVAADLGQGPIVRTNATSRHVDIDLQKLVAAGYIRPGAPGSLIAEEFRVLKRPLLANIAGRSGVPIRNANLIMVTSALPAEGKTFTAVNLAISIAMEFERRVLLVDADVTRPSLPNLLGIPAQKGLLDVLCDKSVHLSEVLLHTNVDKLSVLTAGTPHLNATELLASPAMNRLLKEMAQRYPDRIIVFDAPPLLITTEARVLVTHMGQVLFVVRAAETTQSAVKQALATIEACPVKYLVLNQMRSSHQKAFGHAHTDGI